MGVYFGLSLFLLGHLVVSSFLKDQVNVGKNLKKGLIALNFDENGN